MEKHQIDKLVEHFRRTADPEKIVLLKTDEVREIDGSEYAVLIIIPETTTPEREAEIADEAYGWLGKTGQSGIPAYPFVKRLSDLGEWMNVPCSLSYRCMHEGTVVYG